MAALADRAARREIASRGQPPQTQVTTPVSQADGVSLKHSAFMGEGGSLNALQLR